MLYLSKLGADPELFWMKDGHPHSVEGKLPGTKSEPFPIKEGGFAVQVDNVASEFNIPPADSAVAFSSSIGYVIKYLEKQAKKHGCVLSYAPCLDFSWEQTHTPHALTMGCDPDFSVWTGDVNPRPEPPEQMRTAAGHVHISWEGGVTYETQTLVGKCCDVWLGLPHILATEKNDRRKLYGKAGCIRPKDFGIEYRTLDCSWVRDYRLRKHVFHNAQALFSAIRNSDNLGNIIDSWGDEIQHAINEHDKNVAAKVMKVFYVNEFPSLD